MGRKTIKVKVKKKRLNIKRILLCIITLVTIYVAVSFLIDLPIKNIYIINNHILSDKEVIEEAGLTEYPSFFLNFSHQIKKKLLKNVYIKDVKVTKKFGNKIYIDITENHPLCLTSEDTVILLDGTKTSNEYNLTKYPLLMNDVSPIYDEFITSFGQIKDTVLSKISQIEYSPVEVDKERFILYMNDGNLVYITLTKIEKINKYNSIYQEMEGNKGIIYLDSGDYVEIKEKKDEPNTNTDNKDNTQNMESQ